MTRFDTKPPGLKTGSRGDYDVPLPDPPELLPQPAPITGGGEQKRKNRRAEQTFKWFARAAAIAVTSAVFLIAAFLLWRAAPAIARHPDGITGFLTYTGPWKLGDPDAMLFGIPHLFAATVTISIVALALAMPIALGAALFAAVICPPKLAPAAGRAMDLLAAVPSIVYGLWGITIVGPALGPAYDWLSTHITAVPFFARYENSPSLATGRTLATGGVVLAVMIIPVIAATAREAFSRTPVSHKEAALALGATTTEMIKLAVWPFGRRGFIAGAMLGLGRALGETMALYLVVASAPGFRWSLLDGGTTFATAIANAAPEFNDELRAGAYIAAGLTLFVLTFIVGVVARAAVAKKA